MTAGRPVLHPARPESGRDGGEGFRPLRVDPFFGVRRTVENSIEASTASHDFCGPCRTTGAEGCAVAGFAPGAKIRPIRTIFGVRAAPPVPMGVLSRGSPPGRSFDRFALLLGSVPHHRRRGGCWRGVRPGSKIRPIRTIFGVRAAPPAPRGVLSRGSPPGRSFDRFALFLGSVPPHRRDGCAVAGFAPGAKLRPIRTTFVVRAAPPVPMGVLSRGSPRGEASTDSH